MSRNVWHWKLFETQYSLNKSFICRIILVRWKLRFFRIDEMIMSLTPHSLQYKPMSIIFWTRSFTLSCVVWKGWCHYSQYVICNMPWRVGWMKWCKRFMFVPRKTLNIAVHRYCSLSMSLHIHFCIGRRHSATPSNC